MVLNKANPRTGLSARPVGCLLFKRSRHLPIFTGRFQPTIFGTSELNFCVRNGNRWFLTVIDTGHNLTNVSFSFQKAYTFKTEYRTATANEVSIENGVKPSTY